jgi:nucleoside-diphosphate-sugar epimerase
VKALVTGGSGFLGGHIVEECVRAGDEVRVLVRSSSDLGHLRTVPGIEIVHGDLTDEASLRAAAKGVDVVYHSAARVLDHGSRSQFWAANVAATETLLRAAREGGAERFVFVSSPSAVMTGQDQYDIDESQPYPDRYLNLYSETKAAAERAVLAADAPGFTTCAIRPRGVWGPRDWNGFMPRLMARMLSGRMPDLSGGRQVLTSLCYCTNAAQACLLAARSDRVGGRAFFVTDEEKTDVWAFMAEVAERFGLRPPTRRVPPLVRDALVEAIELVWRVPYLAHRHSPPLSRYSAALLTRSTTYDISAARESLGYRPTIDRATGLDLLQRWVDDIGGVAAFARRWRA